MSRCATDRLRDIISSANLVVHHSGGRDANALAAEDGPRDATLFRVAVVCEAAPHLPADIQALAPEIPWRKVRNMRNEIVHGYWQIDYNAVIDTIAEDLPTLAAAVQRLLSLVERTEK